MQYILAGIKAITWIKNFLLAIHSYTKLAFNNITDLLMNMIMGSPDTAFLEMDLHHHKGAIAAKYLPIRLVIDFL